MTDINNKLSRERLLINHEKKRQDFINLTSNQAIAEAQYPLDVRLKVRQTTSDQLGNSFKKLTNIVSRYGIKIPIKEKNWEVNQSSQIRFKNIATHWHKIETHPYYLYLIEDENFVSASAKFKKKSKQFNIIEFIDFKFVHIVAKRIGSHLLAETIGYQPSYANSKALKQTNGFINKLRDSFKRGVSLCNSHSQSDLDKLLHQLQVEIDLAPRKERLTATSEKRKCIESVALDMGLDFQMVSATILTDLAAMINWHPDHTSIDAIVKKTKVKYKIN